MDLYLVRHAVAFQKDFDRWSHDNKRPLTPEGEEEFRLAARGLARMVPRADVILSSPARAARRGPTIDQPARAMAAARAGTRQPARTPPRGRGVSGVKAPGLSVEVRPA